MKPSLRHGPPLLSVLFLAAAAHSAAAAAPAPLADHIPADALAFFSWQGAQSLTPAYAQSNLKGFLDASTLPAFFSTTLPQIIGERTGSPEAVALAKAQAAAMLLPYWNHPTALYVGPFDFTNPNQPLPRIALLCDAGKDAGRLNAALQNIVQLAAANAPVKISLASSDSLVVLAIGLDANSLLAANPASLGASPAYLHTLAGLNAIASSAPSTPALTGFVDIHGITTNFLDGLEHAPAMTPDSFTKINVVVDALGIRPLNQLALSAGFDGKQWSEAAFIDLPPSAPRVGIVRLLDPPPFDPSALAAIPKNAISANIITFDVNGLYKDIRDTFPKLDPEATRKFDEGLAQIHKNLGIDLQNDFIATLDGRITLYQTDASGLPYVAAIKLKDAPKFAATLAALVDKANASEPEGSPNRAQKQGDTYTLKLPQITLAWAVHGDSFYLSSEAGLADALAFADAKPAQPSLLDNPDFAALRKPYPANLTSLAYTQPLPLYAEVYDAAQLLLPLAHSRLGVDLPPDLLPTPEAAKPFFASAIALTWSGADGIHSIGHSAFPGASILGSQQLTSSAGIVAMGTAILLPAMSRSRELANRTADAANERGIAQSCVIYAADHNDKLPDDLSQLLIEGQVSPQGFTSRRAGTHPLVVDDLDKAKANPAQLATDLAAHCDYIYLGKGATNDMDSSLVLLYEKPRPDMLDGMSLAFDDAHAEFFRWANLAEAFKATNDYRKAHNLPPVDVDSLIPPGITLPAKPTP